MSGIVTDTHALLWYLNNNSALSVVARAAFENAEKAGQSIYVPSIILVELRYLIEKGTITEANYQTVITHLKDPTTALTILTLEIDNADALKQIPRHIVPDMPDRIIAASALHIGLPLVTKDRKIIASGIPVIW